MGRLVCSRKGLILFLFNVIILQGEQMKELLVIVPTRNRPENSIEFYNSFKEVTDPNFTDLIFCLDDDDVQYPRIDGVLYSVNHRMRMNGTLNKVAVEYAPYYKYTAFLGDDHRTRTSGWDRKLTKATGDFGITHGNDLTLDPNGSDLPTAVVMTSNIIMELGYMSPPEFKHLYLDVFWREMGKKLNIFSYHPDIIIEHLHPQVSKNQWDAGYVECNSQEIYDLDGEAWKKYTEGPRFQNDFEKLKRLQDRIHNVTTTNEN